MILFINPLNNFLTKSSKTAKLVYFGVQLIPTPESNKSLQVSSLYYSRLLSFIKHYIDEAITEMETSEATPQTEQIAEPYSSETEIARLNEAVEKNSTHPTPKTSSSSFSKIETDGVKPVETEIKQLEKLLTEPQDTEPTAETLAANTFTGLATPKQETETSPTKPDITDTVLKYISKIDSSLRWAFHTDNENIITVYDGTTEFEQINCQEGTATNAITVHFLHKYNFSIRPLLKDILDGKQINLDNYYTKEEKAPAKKHQNGSKNGKQPDSEPLKSELDKITTTDYIAKKMENFHQSREASVLRSGSNF